jgi:hypothetical protein
MTVTNQNLIQDEISDDQIRVMFATIEIKTFCLPVCSLKT